MQSFETLIYEKKDNVAYITNNVPYINKLNDGHSSQAPAHFVEAAIDQVAYQGGIVMGEE